MIFLVIIALALLFVCCQYRRKKNQGHVEDHYKLHGLAPKGKRSVVFVLWFGKIFFYNLPVGFDCSDPL